jgi:nucleoid DNA-binding protein
MSDSKPATKTAMFKALAEKSELTNKQVAALFDQLTSFIEQELGKKGPGVVTVPGLLKIKRVEKKPQPARMGRNPKTGEPMEISAKPKRTIVKAYALKNLKDMVK